MKDGTVATWTIESMDWKRRQQGVTYKVSKTESGHFHCTCDAFKYGEGQYCKHIDHVQNVQPIPDQERVSPAQLARALNDALMNKHGTVVVRIVNGEIHLSDR